jgi:DNA-binding CsgD family transcriptional regulator
LSTKSKSKTTAKAEQITWRRNKVIELRSRGLTQAEIARELQVSEASICIDMQHIRQMAQINIKHYVTQHLPEQYALALYALDTILRNAYEILQNASDNREKLQALSLFKDTHLQKLELLSNSTTIEQALQFIKSKQQQPQQSEQPQSQREADLPPMQQQEQILYYSSSNESSSPRTRFFLLLFCI